MALKEQQPTHRVVPPAAPRPGAKEPERRRVRGWFGIARAARTRILASYVILLALSAVLSTLAIRQVLFIRLDDRIKESGEQEVLELERLLAVGRDPQTGQPFAAPEALFDAYLARNVPSSEEALLTFVDGRFYRSALARFPLDQVPAAQLVDWADLSSSSPEETERNTGTFDTDLGKAYFRARRVLLGDSVGAFIVTILPAAELEEIRDLQTFGAAATLGVLVIASAFAWLIAGRALAPVRLLTETARTISRSDLTRRIHVYGAGDAAEMARSFNAMLDRLEGVFRSHRAFVQDVSHELRDPLTICRGHLELIGDDPKERHRTIGIVLDEIDRMTRIVNDLQVLAEAEQPDFLRTERIDLGLLAPEFTAKASALGRRRWMLDQTADGTFLADRDRLTEAVMNLAHNAVQHTSEEEAIGIGTAVTDTEVRIWVRDSGRGIAISDQARIFDRFARGKDAHRRYRGGGLGLAIVRAIAEAHGGRVELDSRLGEGSTFTVVVPRDSGEGAADGQNPDR
ncbi:MAG TPA: HAMP domain-containing sensor histidine kinase [Actinomycetota bacterium]|nr:HAMP domain-containing sensor histidine kinase [Actinomycetota bacterium]